MIFGKRNPPVSSKRVRVNALAIASKESCGRVRNDGVLKDLVSCSQPRGAGQYSPFSTVCQLQEWLQTKFSAIDRNMDALMADHLGKQSYCSRSALLLVGAREQ
jgi:hypothetical protein